MTQAVPGLVGRSGPGMPKQVTVASVGCRDSGQASHQGRVATPLSQGLHHPPRPPAWWISGRGQLRAGRGPCWAGVGLEGPFCSQAMGEPLISLW